MCFSQIPASIEYYCEKPEDSTYRSVLRLKKLFTITCLCSIASFLDKIISCSKTMFGFPVTFKINVFSYEIPFQRELLHHYPLRFALNPAILIHSPKTLLQTERQRGGNENHIQSGIQFSQDLLRKNFTRRESYR